MSNQKLQDPFVTKRLKKLEGTGRERPYVKCYTTAFLRQERGMQFDATVDTGGDMTCVPKSCVPDWRKLLNGKRYKVRMADGSVSRTQLKLVTINIIGDGAVQSFSLEDGVLMTNSPVGLIGLDILDHLDVRMIGGVVTLALTGGGG